MAPTNIKRKIRKTRRSLNDMRSRISLSKSSNINIYNMKKNPVIKPIIRDNRLILPNKMVRSETITRTALHELRETYTNVSKENDKYKYCCNKDTDVINYDSTDTDSNTSKSVEMFSPLQNFSFEYAESDFYGKSQNDQILSSSLHSEQEFNENIYEYFLSSFPNQIHETAPNLLLTDFIDKKKQSLKRFFSNIDILSPPELIIKETNIVNNTNNFSVTDRSPMENQADYKGSATPHVQIAYSGNISSSAESIQSVAIYISPTLKYQNLYDSPDYSYYPHRLNY